VKLFALTCGTLTGDLGYLMEGGEGRANLPIPANLIEHPKGTVLFDAGMGYRNAYTIGRRCSPRSTS
jgi:N-acyl homoserine lactone hydrolase